MTNFDSITVDMLDTVSGGYHDPPGPAPAPQGTPGCPAPQPQKQKSLTDQLRNLGKRIAPWILL